MSVTINTLTKWSQKFFSMQGDTIKDLLKTEGCEYITYL